MSNPEVPDPPEQTEDPFRPGVGLDPDEPNPFGPDGPNVRDDEPDPGVHEAAPPEPSSIPLDDVDFAPDES